MKSLGRLFVVGCLFIGIGCHTARNVVVTSSRIVTAPAHFVVRKISGSGEKAPPPTLVGNPPAPEVPASPTPLPRIVSSPPPLRKVEPSPTPLLPRLTPTPRPAATAQYPVAKPVPGKPGFVYSPFDPNGGYVDVSGYASGTKVRDPYSQKIFLVP